MEGGPAVKPTDELRQDQDPAECTRESECVSHLRELVVHERKVLCNRASFVKVLGAIRANLAAIRVNQRVGELWLISATKLV